MEITNHSRQRVKTKTTNQIRRVPNRPVRFVSWVICNNWKKKKTFIVASVNRNSSEVPKIKKYWPSNHNSKMDTQPADLKWAIPNSFPFENFDREMPIRFVRAAPVHLFRPRFPSLAPDGASIWSVRLFIYSNMRQTSNTKVHAPYFLIYPLNCFDTSWRRHLLWNIKSGAGVLGNRTKFWVQWARMIQKTALANRIVCAHYSQNCVRFQYNMYCPRQILYDSRMALYR